METVPVGLIYERREDGKIKNCETWNHVLWPEVLLACTNCPLAYAGNQKWVEGQYHEERLKKEKRK